MRCRLSPTAGVPSHTSGAAMCWYKSWIVVEPWAVVDTPNIDGRTVRWPYRKDGIVIIRCFMPGTMI